MIPISVCIIMKNEEKNIEACLEPLSKYPFELVLVDTGSTDKTKELASKYTDKIFDFEWCDDFSAARNYSLKKASNDWVLVVDCDEFLQTLRLEETYELMQEFPDAVGQIIRHSSCMSGDSKTAITDHVERLFNRKLYHYEGIIHEQVVAIDANADHSLLTVFELPMYFEHVGYENTPEMMAQKANRNIQLLRKDLEAHPDDPYIYYQIGESYNLIGDFENAFFYYDKGLYFDVDEKLPYVRQMVTSYGYSMIETGRLEQALSLEGVYDAFSDYADFVCMMGNLYLKLMQNDKALEQFIHATKLTDHLTDGANSFIPLHNIGCIYEAYGYYPNAAACYKQAADLGYAHSSERLQNLIAAHPQAFHI